MRVPVWLGAAALLVCVAPVAQAHAILIASRPAVGANVSAGKVGLWLRYNSRIDAMRSRLMLTRPDHSQEVLPIAAGSAVDVLESDVSLPPGAYVLRWQVLAVDGHITRGDVPFTVVP
jgi:methionine-rich copper-binding protein CopC